MKTELHQVSNTVCIGNRGLGTFIITTGKGVVYVVGATTSMAAASKFQEALPGAVIASIVQAEQVL